MKGARRNLFLSIMVLMTGHYVASAQDVLNGFLLSAYEDNNVKSIQEQLLYLDGKPYRLAPVQQLQFRTASNQLDPARQGYALRLNPANPWENKNNNLYFKDYRSMLSLKKDLALKDALYQRYLLAIEVLYEQELKALRQKDNALLDAYISVLEKQQYSDFFDGEDYVRLKLDQVDRAVAFEETAFSLDDALHQIGSLYNDGASPAAWENPLPVSLAKLAQVVDSISTAQSNLATLAYHDQRILLAKREYDLKKSNINVGYLQAQYQHYRIDQGRRPWTLSMGVTIPIFNPNKGDMAKRKIEIMEAENDKREQQQLQETAASRARDQLTSLLNRYHAVEQKMKDLENSALTSKLNAMSSSNPAVQIRLTSNMLKLEAIAIKIKQSIYQKYIEFLGHMDVLQQRPLVNYLSATCHAMEQ